MFFDTEVKRDHTKTLGAFGRPVIGLAGRNTAREVQAFHHRVRFHALEHVRTIFTAGGDGSAHRAGRADVTGEGTRVDARESRDVIALEVCVERFTRAPAAV